MFARLRRLPFRRFPLHLLPLHRQAHRVEQLDAEIEMEAEKDKMTVEAIGTVSPDGLLVLRAH